MFPAINFLRPDLAEALLQYRINRIAAAEVRARGYRPPYNGCMFPWQSALSGYEATPTFASYGPDRELHVNGDVAVAAFAYFRATRDMAWLASSGWQLLSGIASFWVSKLQLTNPPPALLPNATDLLHILDVVGPDEFHDHVDDSAYTNAVATLSLRYAAQAAALLGKDPAQGASQWADYASRIALPFNASGPGIPEGGLHPEFAAYQLGVTVKQADTVLLAFPLAFEHPTMTPAAIANE